jgi:predicted TIM-barrel fold metal-dependent hydrolase
MIVDAQVHVWKAETPERPWFTAHPHLPEPFGYEDLLGEMKKAGVDRAVLIPPGWEGDRIDFVLEGAVRHPDRFGVMGRIPVQKREAASALLPGWRAQRGMLGIRVSFQKAHNQRWLTDGTADWFWPEAEKHGIPVMVFAPGRNAELRAIAEAHPKLRIVVDHMGLAREEDAEAAAVIERLSELADCPNVHVKVSSVPLYSTEPYPYRNLHDALRRLIGAFGPERSFWGTDITRIWSRASYRQCVTLFTEELKFLSADDLDWVMGRGLLRCLDWPLTVSAR